MNTYKGYYTPSRRSLSTRDFLQANNETLDLLDYDKNGERSLEWKTKRGYFQIKPAAAPP